MLAEDAFDRELMTANPDDHVDHIDAREFAIDVARICAENKTDDVNVLDLRGLSSIADYFVIGTGTSDRQMAAVLDKIEDHAREIGEKPFKVSKTSQSTWILADYVDVVVHLFDHEHRMHYDLDGLWGDAPQVDWRAEIDFDSDGANDAP